MRSIALAILATVSAGPTLAQGSQSVDDLIRALRPSGGGADRGLGLRSTPTPPSRQGAPVQPRAPEAPPAPDSAPSVNLSVQFRTGSAELTPAARRTLDTLGSALSNSSLASYRFRIEGHTDTVGDPAFNRSLSEHRAAAVVDYLNARFGVDRTRLEAVGMGEERPLVLTGPQAPEPRNRRVQVINLGA